MQRLFSTIILVSSIIILSVSSDVCAGGLSTPFIEVKLENLKLGKIYSVKEETGKSLIIENRTETETVNIAIEPEKPVDYNLVKGYEPIPDTSWVIVEENYFIDVGPGEKRETDILILIPNDERHYNKKYQVYIYSHTTGKAATFRMGLMSRILLHIAGEPSVSAKEELPIEELSKENITHKKDAPVKKFMNEKEPAESIPVRKDISY